MTSAEVVERFLSSCPALNRHRPGNDRVSPSGYVDGCSRCRRRSTNKFVCNFAWFQFVTITSLWFARAC